MKFTELGIPGVFLVEREDRADDRGFFARTYCRKELARLGLDFEIRQCNMSMSLRRGTVRGMHFQKAPHQEIKLVGCAAGALFDCVVDVRPESPTYLRHVAATLHEFGPMLYVPAGFAHGFQTLRDNTIAQYHVSAFYAPEAEDGLRWDDPDLGIHWPIREDVTVSAKDRAFTALRERGGDVGGA